MRTRPFTQVDVFSPVPYLGNPLAVVLDASDLTDADLQRIARWTNLSETTFVLPPTVEDADYRVRIFTPDGELPFAGHPTLGTAHAWSENGGTPRRPDPIVQECAAGLVRIHRSSAGELAFEAPETTRSGPVSVGDLGRICAALGVERSEIVDHQWVANGPQWVAVMLSSADRVLELRPNLSALGELEVGVVGPYPAGSECSWELRAFISDIGEDPVTGSLNASVGQWLLRTDRMPGPYTASQGTALGRAGRVRVTPTEDGGNVLVGGAVTTLVRGSIDA
jgi:PhzF family phenazine biosynthesis protein